MSPIYFAKLGTVIVSALIFQQLMFFVFGKAGLIAWVELLLIAYGTYCYFVSGSHKAAWLRKLSSQRSK